jgi:hypothetical protein
MKNLNSLIGKAAVALFTIVTLVASSPAKANDNIKPKQNTVDVKYIGTVDNRPVFQVVIDNATQENLTIVIKDDNDEILYVENFKGATYSKKFGIDRYDINELKLKVVLSSKNSNVVKTVEINKNVNFVVDFAINEVK